MAGTDIMLEAGRSEALFAAYRVPGMKSIRLLADQEDEGRIILGKTKLGELSDVSKHFLWSERNGRLLPFIAQLNLNAIASYARAIQLPEKTNEYTERFGR